MKMNQKLKKLVLLFIIAALIASVVNPSVMATKGQDIERYTGEEIFKAIAFGAGELAEKIPAVDKSVEKIEHNEETLAIIEKIVREMDSISPGYFNKLEDAVYSKNPVKVDQVMEEGGSILEKALINLDIVAPAQHDADITAVVAGWIAMIGALAYNYAGAVHTAAAAVNAAAYLNLAVYQYVYLWGSEVQTNQLERDMYIVEVIEAVH